MFIGVKKSSGDYSADEKGEVKLVRTIRRVPEEERCWKICNLELVKHVLWNLGVGDKNADGAGTTFDFKNGPGERR